jgi:adenosylhomocysteine nucleosidase
MAAMPQELNAVLAEMQGRTVTTRAGREFHAGALAGRSCVAVFSRWGKVAAASTATELILDHRASAIVFTGAAGSLSPAVRVGDIVVATGLAQHDMDASPLYPRGEVPLLGVGVFETDPTLRRCLADAADAFAAEELTRARPGARTHLGLVASGDRFIADDAARSAVLAACPGALAVEMEGAAVAQVCFEHAVPFGCVRTISDSADEHAAGSVMDFINALAGFYSRGVLLRMIAALQRPEKSSSG